MINYTSSPENVLRRHELVQHLKRQGIADRRVLAAMERVPREAFLDPDLNDYAYEDRALGIECGQTISQPYIVALMTEALELRGSERVLEIGTGSGYQCAVLAELAGDVFSIERQPPLAQRAAAVLAELGCANVHVRRGDGALGWPEEAPFDRVIITAAAERMPQALVDQLADGGILVCPLGDEQSQVLQSFRKQGEHLKSRVLCGCRFVPLVSEAF